MANENFTQTVDKDERDWYEPLKVVIPRIEEQCVEIQKIKDEIIKEMEGWDVASDN